MQKNLLYYTVEEFMIRILLILAVCYGAWWCYNNIDFNAVKTNTINTVKSEKTIQAVTESRRQNADAVHDALGN